MYIMEVSSPARLKRRLTMLLKREVVFMEMLWQIILLLILLEIIKTIKK